MACSIRFHPHAEPRHAYHDKNDQKGLNAALREDRQRIVICLGVARANDGSRGDASPRSLKRQLKERTQRNGQEWPGMARQI